MYIFYVIYTCGSCRGVLLKQCCSTSRPPKKRSTAKFGRVGTVGTYQAKQLSCARVESQLFSFWGWENPTFNGKSLYLVLNTPTIIRLITMPTG